MTQDLRRTTDESAFVKLLATEGRVRILDVLLRKPHVTLTRSEIAELAGVDPTTFDRNKDILEQLGCLESTNGSRRTEYSLDTEHPVVRALGTARAELLEYTSDIAHHTTSNNREEIRKMASQELKETGEQNERFEDRITKKIAASRAAAEQ